MLSCLPSKILKVCALSSNAGRFLTAEDFPFGYMIAKKEIVSGNWWQRCRDKGVYLLPNC
jgi:hypothetical protein